MMESKPTDPHALLTVNGSTRETPLSGGNSLGELLEFVRGIYSTESCCISSIRIDGEEISESAEKALAPLPLSELRAIEVLTAHPRELAEETLQDMMQFCAPLAERSRQAGECFRGEGHPSRELASLVDGINVFTEALRGARQILRIKANALPRIDVLEADLVSIMKDVVHYYEDGETAYVVELLSEHLPRNIDEWKSEGIPALIRSRDS
jgi:hypothetical protein